MGYPEFHYWKYAFQQVLVFYQVTSVILLRLLHQYGPPDIQLKMIRVQVQ